MSKKMNRQQVICLFEGMITGSFPEMTVQGEKMLKKIIDRGFEITLDEQLESMAVLQEMYNVKPTNNGLDHYHDLLTNMAETNTVN